MELNNLSLIKKQYLIIVLLIIIGVYRFSLIDRGAMSFPDEGRYWKAALSIESLVNNDFRGFLYHLSDTYGRPGDATLRIIPIIGQGILYKLFGVDPRNPESLMIATSFNVLVSLLISLVFYKTTLLLFKGNFNIALIGTLVFSLLVNNNIYIRHVLPYDAAFLCFLFTLYYTLKKINENSQCLSIKTCVHIGLLTGFGFTVYPGYYFFPILIFAIIVFRGDNANFTKSKLINYVAFGLSALSVILFYEIISQLGKTSYLIELKSAGGSKWAGSYEEGFIFFAKYLIEVEKSIGVFILIFLILYILKLIISVLMNKPANSYFNDLKLLFLTMLVGYLFHASLTTNFHKMVFQGRLLSIYFPFMVWSILAVISEIRHSYLRKFTYAVMLSLSLYSFVIFLSEYSQLAYPRDVRYKLGIDIKNINLNNIINETKPYHIYNWRVHWIVNNKAPYINEKNLLLINSCYFYPITEDFKPYVPQENAQLIYKNPHFLTFPAYSYEGFKIKERKLLKQRKYQVSVYKLT